MKGKCIVLLLLLALLVSKYAYSLKTYNVSAKYTANTNIIVGYENVVYGIKLTGNVNLNSENSLIRILLHGVNGETVLLHEYYYPLFLIGNYELKEAEENILINGILMNNIEIIVIDASLQLENFTIYDSEAERNQNEVLTYDQIILDKIDRLNSNL